MNCPNCGNELQGGTCGVCGYDRSCDWLLFPTFTPVGRSAGPGSVGRGRFVSPEEEKSRKLRYDTALALEMAASTPEDFTAAALLYEPLGRLGWRDSAQRARRCRDRAASLDQEQVEKDLVPVGGEKKKKGPLYMILGLVAAAAVLVIAFALRTNVQPQAVPVNTGASLSNTDMSSTPVPASANTSKAAAAPSPTPLPTATPLPSASSEPTPKPHIVSIAAGDRHTVGLYSDGTVVAIGETGWPNRCRVSDWEDIIAISAGPTCTVGLKSDGTVVTAGISTSLCDVSSWHDIVAVSAGDGLIVGLKSDGTVVASGETIDFNSGKYTDIVDVSDWHGIKTVLAMDQGVVGLTTGGEVVSCWGTMWDYQRLQKEFSSWSNIDELYGRWPVIGVQKNGRIVAYPLFDELKQEFEDQSFVSIANAWYTVVGLKPDGTVVAVGYDAEVIHQLETWRDIVAVAAGGGHIVGLQSDGTVVAVGGNSYGQCNVSDW